MGNQQPSDPSTRVAGPRVNQTLLQTANLLTITRLASMPLVVYLLLATRTDPRYNLYALGLVVVLQASDVLDGYLARQAKGASRVHTAGEILDPLADKLFINSAVITLTVIGRLPLWAGGLIVLRDLLILGGWLASYLRSGVRLLPNKLGKAADSAQALLIVAVLLQPPPSILTGWTGLTVALTVASGISYLHSALTTTEHASSGPRP